jgi:hypothetical protein
MIATRKAIASLAVAAVYAVAAVLMSYGYGFLFRSQPLLAWMDWMPGLAVLFAFCLPALVCICGLAIHSWIHFRGRNRSGRNLACWIAGVSGLIIIAPAAIYWVCQFMRS